jgi:hypothetical protein
VVAVSEISERALTITSNPAGEPGVHVEQGRKTWQKISAADFTGIAGASSRTPRWQGEQKNNVKGELTRRSGSMPRP